MPEIISKEPLAPAVRHGDDQCYDIVKFSVLALIAAEELGITSANVDEMLHSQNPKIQRFLGILHLLPLDLSIQREQSNSDRYFVADS